MFKRISGALSTVIILAVVFVGIANAQDGANLARVVVTATTSDNSVVFVPQHFIPAAKVQPFLISIGEADFATDLSRLQVCEVLREHPPQNCTTSTYPASPDIPSAAGAEWGGHGCEPSTSINIFVSVVLKRLSTGVYTGDMNKPVRYNPSIDFGGICNAHERHYTSSASKGVADASFEHQLAMLCNAALSDRASCISFKDKYVWVVKNLGGSAYESNQKELACSAWGESMKKSGCT